MEDPAIDAPPNMKRALVAVAMVMAALVVFALFLPPLKRVSQVVEWDGRRQNEYLALGFIPYSSLDHDPELRVTADYIRELHRAGIKPPKDFKPAFCIRSFRMPGLDYYARGTIEGYPGVVEAEFASQGFKRLVAGPGSVLLQAIHRGLKRRVEISTLGSGRAKGTSRIQVAISFDVIPHKP